MKCKVCGTSFEIYHSREECFACLGTEVAALAESVETRLRVTNGRAVAAGGTTQAIEVAAKYLRGRGWRVDCKATQITVQFPFPNDHRDPPRVPTTDLRDLA